MGSNVQEALQRGRGQKGPGIWLDMLKRGGPLLFTVFAWFGLLKGLPEARPFFWFPACFAIAAACFFLYNREKKEELAVAFLLTGLLLPAGAIQSLHLIRLTPLFFPLVIVMTFFFSLPAVLIALTLFSIQIVPASVLQFAGFRPFLDIADPVQAGLLAAFLIMTAGVSSYMVRRLQTARDKAEHALATIRRNARSITHEAELESLSSEETLSHYYASIMKIDEEIRELLGTIKQAVFADSASLFIPDRNSFVLRSSTGAEGALEVMDGGIVGACFRDKKLASFSELDEKKTPPGYRKELRIVSIIAVPILDGSLLVGVLTVDSSRQYAFNLPEKEHAERVAAQLVRILHRERMYIPLKRERAGLRILKEESSNLVTSELDRGRIARRLCEGVERISAAQVFFFSRRGKLFDLVHHNTGRSVESRRVSFDATIINFALENRTKFYVSDVKGYKIPIMPFNAGEVRSVLAIPMLSENQLLGVLVMLSEQVDFLENQEIELIEILCNQASTLIANAKLHAQIERLATTDGLTGLLNHRIFQEKLTGELKRQSRLSGSLALMLTDIDHFKKVNDTYGHPVGDIVLKGVSKIIRETVRDVDIAARYGGEEFAVILPGTDGPGARIIAERLRESVREKTFSADGKTFNVSISIGIAVLPVDAKRKEELIEKADQALYHAKHNGRDQSVLWNSIG
ncbi:MAG: hypothetical protein C0402_01140 [Thermodesulfovibrio sp.]|nr:hypothetical protein [Thermodesulfovibrio sp.]